MGTTRDVHSEIVDLAAEFASRLARAVLEENGVATPTARPAAKRPPRAGEIVELVAALFEAPVSGSRYAAIERAILTKALADAGSVSGAARLLGLQRKVFDRRLRRYRLK